MRYGSRAHLGFIWPAAIWEYTFSGVGPGGEGAGVAEWAGAALSWDASAAGCCVPELHPAIRLMPTTRVNSACTGRRMVAGPRVTVATVRTLTASPPGGAQHRPSSMQSYARCLPARWETTRPVSRPSGRERANACACPRPGGPRRPRQPSPLHEEERCRGSWTARKSHAQHRQATDGPRWRTLPRPSSDRLLRRRGALTAAVRGLAHLHPRLRAHRPRAADSAGHPGGLSSPGGDLP